MFARIAIVTTICILTATAALALNADYRRDTAETLCGTRGGILVDAYQYHRPVFVCIKRDALINVGSMPRPKD